MYLINFISTLYAEFRCWRSYSDIQKNRKSKIEIKKELEESITNGKSKENTEVQEKVSNVTTSEDAMKVIEEFEQIIKNKKNDIIWLAYHQGQLKGKIFKHGFTVSWSVSRQ